MSIKVDEATLLKAAHDVRSSHDEIVGDLRRLTGVVETLGSAWQGQAATRFQELMGRWNDDASKLTGAMSDIADLLDKSSQKQTANEEEQAHMLNSLASMNE